MAVKYRSEFTTNAGSEIDWRIDILDEDFSGTYTTLKCTGDPCSIEYPRRRDVYHPLRGSKAYINLLIEDGDTIDDFNAGSQYQYEVRIRYKLSDDTYKTYWKGWIDPIDGSESVKSYPIQVSFTASDYIGALPGNVRALDDRTSTPLIGYIQRALLETGLGLDLYVDTKIKNADGDALINTNIDERAFWNDDLSQADKKKDVISGILSSFNAVLVQSDGAWRVINASLHGGSGDNETITWNYYEFDAEGEDHFNDVSTTTEDLLFTLGGSGAELLVQGESLTLNTQQPYGSVECVPNKLTRKNYFRNSNFNNTTVSGDGLVVQSASHDQTLTFTDTGGINGNAVYTDRTVRTANGFEDVWFLLSSDRNDKVNRDFPIEISWDWAADIKDGSVDEVRLYYQVYLSYDTAFTFKDTDLSNITWSNWNPTRTRTATRAYWDFRNNNWRAIEGTSYQSSDFYREAATTGSDSEWTNFSRVFKAPTSNTSLFGHDNLPTDQDPRVVLVFYYADARDNGERINGSTSKVSTFIDNVNIRTAYRDVNYEPFFERVQENYADTYNYKPYLLGDPDTSDGFYEHVGSSWWIEGEDSGDARGLEEITTQLKLNDYRSQFKGYSGTLINDSDTPLAIHNKVDISFTNHNETSSCIIYGGRVSLKNNTIALSMFVPNQDTNVAPERRGSVAYDGTNPGFFTYDVDIVAPSPPDRAETVEYILVIQPEGVDDDGVLINTGTDDDPVYGALIPGGETFYYRWVGLPGQTYRSGFYLNPSGDYEIEASTVQTIDTDSKPAPTNITDITYEQIGSSIYVEFEVVIPEETDSEPFYIQATLDELVGDNSRVIFNASNSMTNASLAEGGGNITEIGPVGQTERFVYHVVPSDTYEMKASALTVTVNSVKDGENASDTDVSGVINSDDVLLIQQGTGVDVVLPFKYSETSPVYIDLTFSGAATSIAGEDTVQVQVLASEAGEETEDWSITDADQTITGVPGTPFQFIFEINPESGKYVDAGSITLGSIEESWLGDYTKLSSQQASSEALVFLQGTFPTSDQVGDDKAEITINCNVVDPASTTAVAHTFSWSADATDNYFFNNKSNSYSASLEPGEVATFNISMEAKTGYRLGTVTPAANAGGTPTFTYDVDLSDDDLPTGVSIIARTPYHTNGQIENIDYTMKVVGQDSSQSGTVAVDGSATSQDNLYTLRININSTDAFNAKVNKSFIDIPFGDADLGDNDTTDRTFTIESADSQMEYTEIGNVTYTSSNSSILNVSNITNTISSNVITATIDQITLPSAIPSTGLVEVDLVLAGSAEGLKPATRGEIFYGQEVSSSQVWMDREDTYFKVKVVTDGKWQIVMDASSDGSTYSFWPGAKGPQDSDQTLGYYFVATSRNLTGADRYFRLRLYPQGSTDNLLDTLIVRQRGNYITGSPDVSNIVVLTQTEYDDLSTKDATTFYLIEQ